jgi:hypothetical protein
LLRRIFGAKREEVVGGWRRPHNEELHNLYFLLNIIKAIKSRRIRWVGHVARKGEMKNKGKVVPCALTKYHAMKAYWRSGGKAPLILDLGTRWR